MNDKTETKKVKGGVKPQALTEKVGAADVRGSRISYKDRNKISTSNQDPNYKYRVVNSDNGKYAGRVDKLKEMGYSVVTDDTNVIGDGSGVGAASIGSKQARQVGNGTQGVLMRIPMEWYLEDKASKQAEIDRNVEGMVASSLGGIEGIVGDYKVDEGKTKIHTKITR